MKGYRKEKDSMGTVLVKNENLWGAQTERSRTNFNIGQEEIPKSVIYALISLKKAAANVNTTEGKLSSEQRDGILAACELLQTGEYEEQFPLKVWQTGSGTQTNMNVNEVIACLSNKQFKNLGIHPNDHVNMSQSSNDVFPSAMHIAAYQAIHEQLLPECKRWIELLSEKEDRYRKTIKIGRTHLQDATPVTFGQEISGWRTMIKKAIQFIEESSKHLLCLAIGGTAVGTGISAPTAFGEKVAAEISQMYGYLFKEDENKFYALTSHSSLSNCHGSLRSLAGDLLKIANDIRWLASGPRCGIGEIKIPANEPGSSIMPGKVNPTQAEALTMIVAQVMGNDTTIQVAASQGNFQLNAFKPVVIFNFMQSITILAEGMTSFRIHCLTDMEANSERMEQSLHKSLMLVTALSPHIGYTKSAEIAKNAHDYNLNLRESALALGYANESELDQWLDPKDMIH